MQVYPESLAQRELMLGIAMRAGFAGGVVVDYPHRYAEVNAEMLIMLGLDLLVMIGIGIGLDTEMFI